MAELENARRLEERLQERQRLRFGDLPLDERAAAEQVIGADAVPDRDVAGLARPHRHRQTDQLAAHRVDGREFSIHRRDAFGLRSGDPAGKLRRRPHGRVNRSVDRRARLGGAGADEVGWRALRHPLRGGGRWRGRSVGRGSVERRRLGISAVALEPARGADEARVRFDRGRFDPADLGDPAREGGELHRLEEAEQALAVELRQSQRFERRLHRDVADQRHQLLRDADALDILWVGQRLAPFRLLDLACSRQQRFEIAIFENELRRGLDADAGRAGHVVGRISRERLDVDHLVRPEAEILDHFRRTEAPLLAVAGSRVVHRHPRLDELHQVLVGRDDQYVGARFARLAGIGRDEVVGLVAVLLDRDHAEGSHGFAHQRKLGHEIGRRVGAVGLVGRIDLAPERILRLVENDRQMGRLDPRRSVADELEKFGRKQPHRPHRQPVGAVIVLLILPDRLEIGAEDERRTVDEEHMVAGADRAMGLGHGRHISDAACGRHRRAGEDSLRFRSSNSHPCGRTLSYRAATPNHLTEGGLDGTGQDGISQSPRRRGRARRDRSRRRLRAACGAIVHNSEPVRCGGGVRLCLRGRRRAGPHRGRLHRACRLPAWPREADRYAARHSRSAPAGRSAQRLRRAPPPACSAPRSPACRRASIRPISSPAGST